jgi:hypothetical protein
VKQFSSNVVRFSMVAGLSIGASASSFLYTRPAHADAVKTYTQCAAEWSTCSFSGTQVVRYGVEGHYLFKTLTNGTPCRNEVFGSDPAVGLTKTCSIETTTTTPPAPTSPPPTAPTAPVPSPSTGGYAQCAQEWSTCSFSGTQVVRYGVEGHYVYKTLTNGTPCRNDVFGGDPAVGFTKTCSVSTGASATTPTPPVLTPTTPAPTNGTAKRPSYNLGSGFFVSSGKLYDANGNEFRIRGVNKVHWDNSSLGLNNANANSTRWTIDFTRRPSDNVALLQGNTGSAGTVAKQHVIIPGNWDGTCKEELSYLTRIVDTWVAQAVTWKPLEKYMILNIANEWGPGADGTVWRDAYISAIKRLRQAGYHATISVTAGGCGQDPSSILKWGQAVFDADPEKNVIFDQHIYGVYADKSGGVNPSYSGQPDLEPHVKALAATGLVVMLGEFGPGRNVGPSPTMMNPQHVMQVAETYGLHWLAWAWDDNNLNGGMSDDNSFSLSYSGGYGSSAELTLFGRVVVEDGKYGLKVLAKPASIFR